MLINIRWNGVKYPIEADLSVSGLDFKTLVFSLTGVAPDRQKILVKGGVLGDAADLKTLGWKEGQVLMVFRSRPAKGLDDWVFLLTSHG